MDNQQQPNPYAPQPNPYAGNPNAMPQPTGMPQGMSPQPMQPQSTMPQMNPAPVGAMGVDENPDKSYVVTLLLSWFVGSLGVDRFYLGKVGTGIAKLVTFGGLGFWSFIDLLLVAFGKLRAAGDNRPLQGYAQHKQWAKIVAIVMLAFSAVIIALIMLVALASFSASQDKAQEAERRSQELRQQGSFQFSN